MGLSFQKSYCTSSHFSSPSLLAYVVVQTPNKNLLERDLPSPRHPTPDTRDFHRRMVALAASNFNKKRSLLDKALEEPGADEGWRACGDFWGFEFCFLYLKTLVFSGGFAWFLRYKWLFWAAFLGVCDLVLGRRWLSFRRSVFLCETETNKQTNKHVSLCFSPKKRVFPPDVARQGGKVLALTSAKCWTTCFLSCSDWSVRRTPKNEGPRAQFDLQSYLRKSSSMLLVVFPFFLKLNEWN